MFLCYVSILIYKINTYNYADYTFIRWLGQTPVAAFQ